MRYVLIVAILMATLPLAAQPTQGTLTVKMWNFKKVSGQVRVYLFNSKDGFPSKPAKAVAVRKEPVTDTTQVMTFSDLPFGTYAVSVHHDRNNNDKIDHNFLHIPNEPYGASNNARSSFGPPSFERAKFEFKRDTTIEIKVK